MYRSIIKPILFSLTIERAHRAVLILLREKRMGFMMLRYMVS